MKTHINQILTAVGFFSMSLTTTLIISWGMNGFMIEESKDHGQCLEKEKAEISVIQSEPNKHFNLKISNGMKLLIPKITLKSNGQ